MCNARLYSEACWESLKGSEKGKARQTDLSISVLSHASVFVFSLFFFVCVFLFFLALHMDIKKKSAFVDTYVSNSANYISLLFLS